MRNKFDSYKKAFSEHKMWQKIQHYAKQAGLKTIYSVLLLYNAYKRKDTPAWAKRIVLGTLGYFISPIDLLPDLTPIIGYTDDIGVLSFGLIYIATYINEDVRTQSRQQLSKWFGQYNEEELEAIDKKL